MKTSLNLRQYLSVFFSEREIFYAKLLKIKNILCSTNLFLKILPFMRYCARLLDITMNNGILPGDWKRATVIPIHKGGDR